MRSLFGYIPPRLHRFFLLILFLLLLTGFASYLASSGNTFFLTASHSLVSQDTTGWRAKADRMVRLQVEARGITDERVLEVMRKTPRHLFVPPQHRKRAYRDRPLPIGHGQTISQPYIVALMTDHLQLTGQEKVLEIGTGSGYQAAVLAQLADSVYTIEIVKTLADSSRALLNRLGYDNVRVRHGDGYKGWPAFAPFDAVIVTAAPETVPEALKKQLKVGGRMILPVGQTFQNLVLLEKEADGFTRRQITSVRFVPMIKPED